MMGIQCDSYLLVRQKDTETHFIPSPVQIAGSFNHTSYPVYACSPGSRCGDAA